MDFFSKIISIFQENWAQLLLGLGYTILLAIVGTLVGLIFGMGLALLRNLKTDKKDKTINKVLKKSGSTIAVCYIELFRGTPMMVQAMIIYFGGAALSLMWNPIICGLVVISLNTSAYMAEIIRSGINSIDKGQNEAARSLGMNHFQTMIYIIIPQAIKNVIPSIGNELIVNIKDSSVLNVISVTELFYVGKIIAGNNYLTLETYIVIAIMYLCLTLICSISLHKVEKKLDFDPHKRLKVVTLDE